MEELAKKAMAAAARMVGKTVDVCHVATLESGENVFHVDCEASKTRATVTLNPNGLKASVEWKSGTEGTNYKICDLRDLSAQGDDLATTLTETPAVAEEKN